MRKQRGLAAAGGPEQREELARLDVEADIVHRDRGAPALGDVAEADDGLHGGTGAFGQALIHGTYPFGFF